MDALKQIAACGILPVIAIPEVELADPLADALVRGGINAIEVTLRNACALEALARIRARHPSMSLGAGTILTLAQVEAAKHSGADFLVSPGLDPEIVTAATAAGLPIVPGVADPTQITLAHKMGLRTLKFFPSELSGGVAALTLYHGPFSDVAFVPTGGLTVDNIGAYLSKPFVAACGGSFMAASELVRERRWDAIEKNCRMCVEIAREARK